MDKVVLDGTTYVKASVAAKEFKYTADYVGQLCRAKKIDARLVGRTWFVNPESLVEHKSNKYSSLKTDSKTSEESTDISINIKAVSPVLTSKAAKSINHSLPTNETRSLRVSYEQDEETLIPHINKQGSARTSKTISVKPYDSKKIRVKGGVAKNTASFIADELPEVALSGKLTITPIEEAEDANEPEQTTHAELSRENIEKKDLSDKRDVDKHKLTADKDDINARKVKKASLSLRKKAPQSSRSSHKVQFSPNSVSASQAKPVKISAAVLASPLIASVLALLCVGLIFSASSNATVTLNSYQGGVMLQVANLLEVLSL